MCLFPFQNSTSNKYHLSGLELSAALPDMASKSVLNIPCLRVCFENLCIFFFIKFFLPRAPCFQEHHSELHGGNPGPLLHVSEGEDLERYTGFLSQHLPASSAAFWCQWRFCSRFVFLFSLLKFLSFVL